LREGVGGGFGGGEGEEGGQRLGREGVGDALQERELSLSALESVGILKGYDGVYREEAEADGAHELAGCHSGGHVGSCVGVELQCQCFLGTVAGSCRCCWWVSVFTCNAPQSIELELCSW